jgi:hypothetical protein
MSIKSIFKSIKHFFYSTKAPLYSLDRDTPHPKSPKSFAYRLLKNTEEPK